MMKGRFLALALGLGLFATPVPGRAQSPAAHATQLAAAGLTSYLTLQCQRIWRSRSWRESLTQCPGAARALVDTLDLTLQLAPGVDAYHWWARLLSAPPSALTQIRGAAAFHSTLISTISQERAVDWLRGLPAAAESDPATNLWDSAMAATGSASQALSMLGVLLQDGSLAFAHGRYLESLHRPYAASTLLAATEALERAWPRGQLYPRPVQSTSDRWYHFYSLAWLTHKLRGRRVAPAMAAFMVFLLNASYEQFKDRGHWSPTDALEFPAIDASVQPALLADIYLGYAAVLWAQGAQAIPSEAAFASAYAPAPERWFRGWLRRRR